jgi:hypothetical protein
MRAMKLVAFASVIALAACGPKSSGNTTDPCKDPCKGKPVEGSLTEPLPPGQWERMDHEARETFMENVVEPTMREKFQAFDPEGFAEFGCATCHGAGAADDSYKMPNPDLPQLHGSLWEDPGDDKAIFEFMDQTVEPTMSDLLGIPPKVRDQPGFSCGSCHTFAQD